MNRWNIKKVAAFILTVLLVMNTLFDGQCARFGINKVEASPIRTKVINISNYTVYNHVRLVDVGNTYAVQLVESIDFSIDDYIDRAPGTNIKINGKISWDPPTHEDSDPVTPGYHQNRRLYVFGLTPYYRYYDGYYYSNDWHLYNLGGTINFNDAAGNNILSESQSVILFRFVKDGSYMNPRTFKTTYSVDINITVEYTLNNKEPAISVLAPSSDDIFGTQHTAVVPRISVSDPNGDALTCKYYIDGVEKETKTVAGNTKTAQTINFTAVNIGSLLGGAHTMKFTVSDGYLTDEDTIDFTVDKTPPTVAISNASSTENSITINGSASDTLAGLDILPYRYIVTDGTSIY